MVYYSQDKQDEFLEKNVFKGLKNGFFVDIGAHDGKSINNTLYFEENNNWTGINIEPIIQSVVDDYNNIHKVKKDIDVRYENDGKKVSCPGIDLSRKNRESEIRAALQRALSFFWYHLFVV